MFAILSLLALWSAEVSAEEATATTVQPQLLVELPPFPAVVSQSTATAFATGDWKGKTYARASITLDTPFPMEGLEEEQDLVKAIEALGLKATDSEQGRTQGDHRIFSFSTGSEKNGPGKTVTGEQIAGVLGTLSLKLLPDPAPRNIILTLTPAGEGQTPLTVAVPVVVKVRSPARSTPRHVLVNETFRLGQWIDLGAAQASIAADSLQWLSLEGRDLQPGDVLTATDERAVVDGGTVKVTVAPATGTSRGGLDPALQALRSTQLALSGSRRGRQLILRAGFLTGDSVTTFDIGVIDVLPQLPAIPAACVAVAPVRRGKGFRAVQGWDPSKVVRYSDVLAASAVVATLKPDPACVAWVPADPSEGGSSAKDPVGAGGPAIPLGDRNQGPDMSDYSLRLTLTKQATTDTDELGSCAKSAECINGKGVQSPLFQLHDGARHLSLRRPDTVPAAVFPFRSAWEHLHGLDALDDDPEGMKTLYAHVELVTADGSNAQTILSNQPVSLLVDRDDPLFTFEIVTHPAATSVGILQCRDVLGDSSSESDGSTAAAQCADMPNRTVFSESISVIPIGLHFRWAPFYEQPWLGFGVDAGFLALGASGFITGNTAAGSGLQSLANVMGGLDLSANGNDAGATRLNFLIGGGAMFLKGKDGTFARPFFGLTMTTPILSTKDKARAAQEE